MTTIVLDGEKKRERALYVIGELSLDRPWDVTIEPHKEQRTTAQNARLWKLHTLAGNHLGYSPEEMHEFALCRHFGYAEKEVTDPLTGEIQTKRVPNKRSSTRDVKEFAEFMTRTEEWYIADFGCFLGE